ncbi:hypothetical protein BH10ACI1_BH10ACI1_22530 [soil metagenome]
MKFFKLSLITFTVTAFLMGCNKTQTDDTTFVNPNSSDVTENQNYSDEGTNFARENLDLQAVGNLLEKAKNAEEFEYLLNSTDGVNNLDLNGDGYVDYLSVSEYDNSYDNQRGFTLFDRFGTDEIQEIARIIFDRDRPNAPGTRILLNGNEQLYGDNYNYETNWLDKSLAIADWAFGKRDSNYQSSYYYDNYPEDYAPYRVVETPLYRTRITEYYPQPVFVRTVNPTITQIKIKSPYYGKTSDKIFAKLTKPTKEQIDFRRKNPNKPQFVEVKNNRNNEFSSKNNKNEKDRNESEDSRREKNDGDKREKNDRDNFDNRNRSERSDRNERRNVESDKREKNQRENVRENKQNKSDKQNKQNGDGKGNGGKGNGKGKKN